MMHIVAERADVVRQWRASGKTATRFAQERGLAVSTLRWWVRELDQRGRRGAAGTSTAPAPVLARVIRSGETPPPDAAEEGGVVTLEIGSVRLKVGAGFDASLLREVVRALSEPAR